MWTSEWGCESFIFGFAVLGRLAWDLLGLLLILCRSSEYQLCNCERNANLGSFAVSMLDGWQMLSFHVISHTAISFHISHHFSMRSFDKLWDAHTARYDAFATPWQLAFGEIQGSAEVLPWESKFTKYCIINYIIILYIIVLVYMKCKYHIRSHLQCLTLFTLILDIFGCWMMLVVP